MDLDDIKAIIDLMKQNDLAVFKLEREGFKLELETQPPAAILNPASFPSAHPSLNLPSAVSANSAPSTVEIAKSFHREILSPMVGTFYRAPSPDSAPYAEVGQIITEESVVCIIEAMKVMNEIKAEISGSIVEILVENGTPVQFGQPLFRVK